MPLRVDHVADAATGGKEFIRLAKQYTLPDFVKQASLEYSLLSRPTPPAAYADLSHSQFPCDTAASTWLSTLFFHEKKAEFHPKEAERIERRLESFAQYWRIKTACDTVKHRWIELHKTAEEQLPDSSFAYICVYDNGVKERRLPLTNAMECKAAADWYLQYRDNFNYTDRRAAATKILEKSARFGAGLGTAMEFVERQAGHGVCDPAEVAQMLRNRGLMTKEAELRTGYNDMADAVVNLPRIALQPDFLRDIALIVDGNDRRQKIAGCYSEKFPRPEDVLFRATFSKTASDLATVVATTSGKVYEKKAFKKLSLDDVSGLFGLDFADRVRSGLEIDPEKMAEEVGALPRPDAELLDGLLSDNGVAPMLHKAASAKQGFAVAEQERIAREYVSQ